MFRSRHTFSMDKNHHRRPEKNASFSHPTGEQEPKSDSDRPSVPTPPPLPPSIPLPTAATSPAPAPETPEAEENSEEVLQLAAIEEKEKEEVDEIISSSANIDTNLVKLSEDVDQFLAAFYSSKETENEEEVSENRPEIPECLEQFAKLVQVEIVKCVSGDASTKLFDGSEEEPSILESIDRISKLTKVLGEFQSEKEVVSLVNLTSTVLHRAMSYLEEEFRTLLDIPRFDSSSEVKSKKSDRSNSSDMSEKSSKKGTLSFSSFKDPDRSVVQPPDTVEEDNFPGYSLETLAYLKKLAGSMVSSGYVTECCQVYRFARRSAFEDGLNKLGFEKISMDDVQKMQWEALEAEIVTWVRVTKQAVNVYFPEERKICEHVFSDNQSVYGEIFSNLIANIILHLLNFAEAVGMTKRSAEKLFKFLDMYETLRDLTPTIDELFGDDTRCIKQETQTARSRLAEAAVAIFCDLENSIKSDVAKTPVPGGAVHPLTRYTVNYLKYACEYKDTLEQVFQENRSDDMSTQESNEDGHNNHQPQKPSPFAEELTTVMDLLDSNLEAKSKLYKDLSLSYIFLMNNGRYILQKIKESVEIYNLLGNTWSRKKSTDLRQFHKNYQRETWFKVLDCLKDQGLVVNGKVLKPVLKERFKSFNAMFEEIHKSQTTWIVTDQQLQSELQVSISAVIIPAYRSFLARFQQTLDPGRQTEKYIKLSAEDIESQIGDLFSKRP